MSADGSITVVHDKLLLVDAARESLAKAMSLQDVLDLRAKAEALETYYKLINAASESHASAWAIKQEANRRLGELVKGIEHANAGRPKKAPETTDGKSVPDPVPISKNAELKRLNISKGEANRLEKLAALPRQEFEARRDQGVEEIKRGGAPKNITAASQASNYDGDEYGTPAEYLEAVREVLGGIELDPASNAFAANVVRAARHYTKQDSGLRVEWKVRTVFMNPPFSKQLIKSFVDKFLLEWEADNFGAGIVLTNCDPGVSWCERLIGACSAFCMVNRRISFEINGTPLTDNRYSQCFFYFGSDLKAFHTKFTPFGHVCTRVAGFF